MVNVIYPPELQMNKTNIFQILMSSFQIYVYLYWAKRPMQQWIIIEIFYVLYMYLPSFQKHNAELSKHMHGSRKFSRGGGGGGKGGPPSDQGWSNKFFHRKNPYFGKSRGGLNPLSPLWIRPCSIAWKIRFNSKPLELKKQQILSR